jgi:transcription elongation GreA/GreB family factor
VGVSKAFTREDDGAVPEPPARRRGVPVPEPNPVTPDGLAAAKAELAELARRGGDADRARELTEHLATAHVIEVTDREVVGLGATVTVDTDHGERRYRIVGAIEADAKRGWISWQSVLATALWGLRVGDAVDLPRGEHGEIAAIAYA